MKKILYIVSTLRKSGPVNQLSYIIKYLDKSKYEPMVLTLSHEDNLNSMENYFVDVLKVNVDSLGLSRLGSFLWGKQKIRRYIKLNNISIVHSQGFRSDQLLADIDIYRVATLRNYPYLDYPMTYGKILGNIMARKHLNSLKKIDCPFTVSKSIATMLKVKNRYDINFIRNGTDMEKFQNLDKDSLRKKLNIDPNVTLFVSVGHLSNRKDPLTIIEAFLSLRQENCKLIFLGDGNLRETCSDLIRHNLNIELLGRVDNVQEYLGASDFFISASLAEGLPNTVLEAMACGLPCILSDIPPHTEIFEINSKSSLLFETGDIESLKQKILLISKKKYELMSISSRQIVEEYLNAKKMSSMYQKIYSRF